MNSLDKYCNRTTPRALADELSQFFLGTPFENGEFSAWRPAVDVAEDKESFRLHAELPGLKKEDVKISIKENVLTLRGEKKCEDECKKKDFYRIERCYGVFARQFALPKGVDATKIAAKMTDGVLEVMIPKLPEAQEREVTIDVH